MPCCDFSRIAARIATPIPADVRPHAPGTPDRLDAAGEHHAHRLDQRATDRGPVAGHHDLSNHGKDPGKLDQLKVIKAETIRTLGEFLAELNQSL